MKGSLLVILLAAALTAAHLAPARGDQDMLPEKALLEARAELDKTIKAIFARSCATSGCHVGERPSLQLDLSAEAVPASLVNVQSRQNREFKLIDTADPSKSYLLLKLTGGKGMRGKIMPLRAKQLPAEELADISAWVTWFAGTGAEPDQEAESRAPARELKVVPLDPQEEFHEPTVEKKEPKRTDKDRKTPPPGETTR